MQDEKIEWQWEGGEWYENLPIVAWAGPFNSGEGLTNC